MAFNITPFKNTDEFSMAGFNGKIQEINNGVGAYANEYWWRRRLPAGEQYVEVKTNISSSVDMVRQDSISTCQLSKYITINQTSGVISLDSPETVNAPTSISEVKSTIAYLSPKAPFYFQRNGSTVVYYVPQDATFTDNLFSSTYTVSGSIDDNDRYAIMLHAPSNGVKGQKVTTTKQTLPAGDWQYLHSPNRSAYPDSGTSGGYEYEYLGIPFDNAVNGVKIETGSYVGTGKYGASNPNTLTFGVTPKVIFIYINDSSKTAILLKDQTMANNDQSSTSSATLLRGIIWAGNTVSWYNIDDADQQLNTNGTTYTYIAIG